METELCKLLWCSSLLPLQMMPTQHFTFFTSSHREKLVPSLLVTVSAWILKAVLQKIWTGFETQILCVHPFGTWLSISTYLLYLSSISKKPHSKQWMYTGVKLLCTNNCNVQLTQLIKLRCSCFCEWESDFKLPCLHTWSSRSISYFLFQYGAKRICVATSTEKIIHNKSQDKKKQS